MSRHTWQAASQRSATASSLICRFAYVSAHANRRASQPRPQAPRHLSSCACRNIRSRTDPPTRLRYRWESDDLRMPEHTQSNVSHPRPAESGTSDDLRMPGHAQTAAPPTPDHRPSVICHLAHAGTYGTDGPAGQTSTPAEIRRLAYGRIHATGHIAAISPQTPRYRHLAHAGTYVIGQTHRTDFDTGGDLTTYVWQDIRGRRYRSA